MRTIKVVQKPACFDTDKQYRDWLAMARLSRPGADGHCADCTQQYQAQMLSEGRCGYPDVQFVEDKEVIKCADGTRRSVTTGFVHGRRSINDKRALRRAA